MSSISISDDNTLDGIRSIRKKNDMKSMSSDDIDEFLTNISMSQKHITNKTEIQYINRNPLPDVTIYPTNIHFATTYPNKSLQSKIIISNGGAQTEIFSVSLKGDPEFSVSTRKVTLSPGDTQSLIISFSPKKVSLFNSSLIFEGRTSIVAPITGHCITSPLEYPQINSASWCFPKKKTEKLVAFTNNSLAEPLTVVLSTNCTMFKISPKTVDIPPSSSTDIQILFDPKQIQGSANETPSISIQCSQSGDSAIIPLIIAPKRETIVVDFGCISVGRKMTQNLKLKCPQIAPTVQWPFSVCNISKNGMPQNEMLFSFTAREVGEYRAKVPITDFDIELKASAVDPPYRVKIPNSFPLRPFKVQNICDSMLNLVLSLNNPSFSIDPEKVDLRPNQVSEINVYCNKTSINNNLILKIVWSNSDGKRVVDEYELPFNQAKSSIEIESEDTSIVSSKKQSVGKSLTEISANEIESIATISDVASTRSIRQNQMSTVHKIERNEEKSSKSYLETTNKRLHERNENLSKNSAGSIKCESISIQQQAASVKSASSQKKPAKKLPSSQISSDYYYDENEESRQKQSTKSKHSALNQSKQSSSMKISTPPHYNRKIYVHSYDYDYEEENVKKNDDDSYDYDDNIDKNNNNNCSSDSYIDNNEIKEIIEEKVTTEINNKKYNKKATSHTNSTNTEKKSEVLLSSDYSDSLEERKQHKIKKKNISIDTKNENKKHRSELVETAKKNQENKSGRSQIIKKNKYYTTTEDSDNNEYYRKLQKAKKYRSNHIDSYGSQEEEEEEEQDINYGNRSRSKRNPQTTNKDKYYADSTESRHDRNVSKKHIQRYKGNHSDYSYSDSIHSISEGNSSKGMIKRGDKNDLKKKSITKSTNISKKSSKEVRYNESSSDFEDNDSSQNAEDLRTQMTQTKTLGNGLQSHASQTQDEYDQMVDRSFNNKNISENGNINNNNSNSIISQNRTDLETQTFIQSSSIKYPSIHTLQNGRFVSFSSELTNFSQQHSRIVPSSSSYSVIPFFAISARHPSRFDLTINSETEIEIEAPQWIQMPSFIEPNQPISMIVSSIPSNCIQSTFTVHSESGDLSIPIFAYRGSASFEFDSEIEMIEITDDQYTAAMLIKNSGDRAGFIAFTLPETLSVDLRVSPSVAIIQPKSNLQVKFLVTSKSTEFTIPVVAYYGDEIVRQLHSAVAPNDFFASSFNDIEITNEISSFENVLQDIKPRDILKLFKKSAMTSKLVFKSPQRSLGLSRVTISPSVLEFVGNEENRLSLLNLSPDPLTFSISATSNDVIFSPRTGVATPYGETVITASLERPIDAIIVINIGKEVIKVPIKHLTPNNFYARKKNVKHEGYFSISDNHVEFDCCNIYSSKNMSLTLVNNEQHSMNLSLNSDNPSFYCTDKNVSLRSNESKVITIDFSPKTVGVFKGNLVVQNDQQKIVVGLSGEGVDDAESVSAFVSHPLEFPVCEPDTIRRAQLRVSNRTDNFVEVKAKATPPFFCPYPVFEVEPYSYVLVPVRFIPKSVGDYTGTAEFKSSNGTVSVIDLIGSCIEV